MATVHKVMLTGEHFAKLVKGEILTIWAGEVGARDKIEIGLQDVGFSIMRHHIDQAEKDAKDASRPSSD